MYKIHKFFFSNFSYVLVKTYGSAVYGVEAISITVEVNVSSGRFTSIGILTDNAVESILHCSVLGKEKVNLCK